MDLSRSRPQISEHSFQIKFNQNRPCLKLWITVTLPSLSEFWLTKIPAIKNAKRSYYPNINFQTCLVLSWFSLVFFFFFTFGYLSNCIFRTFQFFFKLIAFQIFSDLYSFTFSSIFSFILICTFVVFVYISNYPWGDTLAFGNRV